MKREAMVDRAISALRRFDYDGRVMCARVSMKDR
jgi:hypothetical protein